MKNTHTVHYVFSEGEEVRLKADPDRTKLIVVALHTQNFGNSYTVSNGISYTGVHCDYELESLTESGSVSKRAGFGNSQNRETK